MSRTSQRMLLRLTQSPMLMKAGQGAVRRLAQRTNYYVLRGMADAASRPDVDLSVKSVPWSITTDFVRHGTVHLLARELRDRRIEGAIGELGVFRGDFSFMMSELLPGRDIHLYDTFAGFDARDVEVDARAGVVDDFIDFTATDVKHVRSRFVDPARVHVHQGWFPESVREDDATPFALVSIDADLYAPVLAGMRWFYERLVPGGYILVHDYSNNAFGGAKQAVRDFRSETGVPTVPIPDWGGTVVVSRPG